MSDLVAEQPGIDCMWSTAHSDVLCRAEVGVGVSRFKTASTSPTSDDLDARTTLWTRRPSLFDTTPWLTASFTPSPRTQASERRGAQLARSQQPERQRRCGARVVIAKVSKRTRRAVAALALLFTPLAIHSYSFGNDPLIPRALGGRAAAARSSRTKQQQPLTHHAVPASAVGRGA